MSLRIIFLGTSGSIPTPQRGLPAIAIRRQEELILFDCGESIQRQMISAGVSFHRRTKILVTHMHGDHVFGLPGLLQTMSLMNRERQLEVYGPSGIRKFVEAIERTVSFSRTFPIEVSEIENAGTVCDEKEYWVHAAFSDHEIPSLAYALMEKPRPGRFFPKKAKALNIPKGPLWSKLQRGSTIKLSDGRTVKPEEVLGEPRPGRKIVYSGDTRMTNTLIEFSRNADLLIHESTFGDELKERATKDGHSTSRQAATIAKKARVKRLVLTHISARYKDSSQLLRQAKSIFPNSDMAEDFMEIELPLSDS